MACSLDSHPGRQEWGKSGQNEAKRAICRWDSCCASQALHICILTWEKTDFPSFFYSSFSLEGLFMGASKVSKMSGYVCLGPELLPWPTFSLYRFIAQFVFEIGPEERNSWQ